MNRTTPLRTLILISLAAATGCSTTRTITFSAIPADAKLKIDGIEKGTGPVTQDVTFHGQEDVHNFGASRKGYKDQFIEVRRDDEKLNYGIVLRPQTKLVTIGVLPVPGQVSIDGKPTSMDLTRQVTTELPFTVDAKDQWTTHTIKVTRPNFAPDEKTIGYNDNVSTYVLTLKPQTKSIVVTSNPPGATISVDGQEAGASPATATNIPFAFDVESGAFIPHTIKATKPGYDPVEKSISWDDGKADYTVDLLAKSKTVRLVTDPANCMVEIDGTKYPVDDSGTATVKLEFPPINDAGDLKTYKAVVSKKTGDSEWYPQTITLAWDNGKSDYGVVLKEILTRPVPLTYAEPTRGDNGWQFKPRSITTLAYKDVTEGARRNPPTQLTKLPKGTMIDSLSVSPDGSSVLFSILLPTSGTHPDFNSQLMLVKADGSGGPTYLSDGKSLDLTPTFSPDGSQIVFASNRAGNRLSIWQMSATGAPGVTQLTTGETTDLWPSLDTDPRQRMYYQSFVDTRPDARLFSTQLGTTMRTDLTQQGGMQPRVSPKADQIVFVGINERTGKRDLFLMSDKGGQPQNLTNTPDSDEFDPVWNKDGSQIAFVSDRGTDVDKQHNYDIWVMDVTSPATPTQVTSNGSWDDSPGWDATGAAIYFRSNRGGDWNIWKAAVK